MSPIEVDLDPILYLSPSLAVGIDPSGQPVAIIRKEGEPKEKLLELIQRAANLCNYDYLEEPYYFKGRWHQKLKEKGDGKRKDY
jgi:hypothetical protein